MAYEIVIRLSVESETEAIKTADQAIKALGQSSTQVNQKIAQDTQRAAEQTNQAYERHAQGALKARTALLPLAAGISLATANLQAHSPAVGAAVGAIDNFVIAAVAGGAATGGWGGALTVMRSILSPWTALVLAAGAAIAYFITQSRNATEAQKTWGQTLDALEDRLATVRAHSDAEKLAAQNAIALHQAQRAVKEQLDSGKISTIEATRQLSILNEKFAELGKAELTESVRQRMNALRSSTRGQLESSILEFADRERQDLVPGLRALFATEAAAAQQFGVSLDEVRQKIAPLRAAFVQLQGGDASSAAFFKNVEDALEQLDPAIRQDIKNWLAYAAATAAARDEQQRMNLALQSAKDFGAFLDAQELQRKESDRAAFDAQTGRRESILEKLRAAGAPDVAILQQQIALLQQRKQMLEASDVQKKPGEIAEIQNQVEIAQIQLYKLQNTGIDVAGEVARAVTDITTAVVNGTLKWADIGKSILASFVRLAMEQFTNFLRQMQQTAQANSVLAAAGGGTLPSGSAGGGIFQSLFGGGSSGGGGGGFLSSILPSGSSLGGLLSSGLGGAIGGGAIGGSGMGNILGGIGSMAGNLLGATGFGQGILTSVFDLFTGVGASLLGFGGAAAAGMFGELIGNFLLPGIGTIIGGLIALFMKQEIPKSFIKIKTDFAGLSLTQFGFNVADAAAKVIRSSNVDKQMKEGIRSQTEAIAEGVVGAVGDLLSILPKSIQAAIDPLVQAANLKADALLDFKIRAPIDEFAALVRRRMGDLTFKLLQSFSAPLSAALGMEIERIGLPVPSEMSEGFIAGLNKFISSKKKKDRGQATTDVLDAMEKVFQLSTQLEQITRIMTAEQRTAIGGGFANILNTGSPQEVEADIGRFQKRFGPMIDFLRQAQQQSADLFGRGIVAALQAASESEAKLNFLKTLGDGARQMLFQGIANAFVQAAQFQDFLAPLQQVIHKFVEDAVETGLPPDMAAFRSALLPLVEDFSTRAELLAPLIAELQKLGVDVKSALSGLTLAGANIVININGSVNNEQDARTIADRIFQHMEAALPPPS